MALGMGVLVVGGTVGQSTRAADAAAGTSVSVAFPEGVHDKLIKRVTAAQAASYDEIIKELDQFLAAHRNDSVAAVEKCRFIANFTDADESVFIESADKDLESCNADLEDVAIANSEDVLLYKEEVKWGDEAAADGETLLRRANAKPWTAAHLAALHEHLYDIYSAGDKQALKAGAHALAAVEGNPASRLRLAAAEYLVRTGARSRAVGLLQPGNTVQWSSWQLEKVTGLLVELGESALARALIANQSAKTLSIRTRVVLAKMLAKAGELTAARQLLAQPPGNDASSRLESVEILRDRFHLELDFGDRDTAVAAYRDLRRRGWSADPLAHDRLSLLLAYPWLPLTGGDVLGICALIGSIILCALVPLLAIAPIHYRSLAKQLRGEALPPPAPWGLGHLWYALALMMVVSWVSLYVWDYPLLATVIASGSHALGAASGAGSSLDLGRTLLWQSLLTFAGLTPLLLTHEQRSIVRGQWSLAKSVLIGVGASLGFLMIVGVLTVLVRKLRGAPVTGALGSATTQALQGIQTQYGLLALVAVVCVIVPFVEEVIFRGVFLQAAGRRLAVWAAVVLQAAVFAALHEEPGVLFVIFALALLTAWLARRSQGLLAPMVCHGTNNAIALIAITRMTAALNGAS